MRNGARNGVWPFRMGRSRAHGVTFRFTFLFATEKLLNDQHERSVPVGLVAQGAFQPNIGDGSSNALCHSAEPTVLH